MAPGKGETPGSILNDYHCEELVFSYFSPEVNFGYEVKRKVPLSPVNYFNQRLLNFRHFLEFCFRCRSYCFASSIVEQHHLRFSINISSNKVQGMQLTAGSVRHNYKEPVKRLLSNENAFHFMNPVKDIPVYWGKFLYEVIAMLKQL